VDGFSNSISNSLELNEPPPLIKSSKIDEAIPPSIISSITGLFSKVIVRFGFFISSGALEY
jgi:hypothetical protein